MTVAKLPRINEYQGTAGPMVFPVKFQFFTAADLSVMLRDPLGVEKAPAAGSFAIAGGNGEKGTVTFAGSTAGYSVVIRGRTEISQKTEYPYGNNFPSSSHERAVDRAAMIDQEQQDQIDDTQTRSLMVPAGEGAFDLPIASVRAGSALVFNAQGQPIAMPVGSFPPGPAGAANNTRVTLADLKAADPADISATLTAPGLEGAFLWTEGNFTGKADDIIVVFSNKTGYPPTTGAWVRVGAVREFMDYIPRSLRADVLAKRSPTNFSAHFKRALVDVEAQPFGGIIRLPPCGLVMDLDVHKQVTDFTKPLTIIGAGRGATTIWPATSQGIGLFAAGRNVLTVTDLTLSSGDGPAPVQAQCGIYIGRLAESPNANNCKFINVELRGNYSKGAVLSFGAESAFWLNCRFADDDFQSKAVGLVSGEDPALSGIIFPPNTGTPIIGPNTDNRMVGCETYLPFQGAEHMRFIGGGAWQIDGHAFIGGTNDHQRMVIREAVANVFSGRIATTNCHYEVFGTGNVVHWMGGGGSPAFYSVVSEGGIAVVDNGCTFIDFDRTQAANGGPILIAPALTMPALPPSITSGLPIYVFGVVAAHIDWRARDSNGTVAVFSFAADCTIHAYDARIADAPRSDIPIFSDAKPVSGTFARGQRVTRNYSGPLALGDEEAWINTVPGTMGVLANVSIRADAGANFGTVDNNGGIKPGHLVSFGGQQRRVTAVEGSRVYFLGPVGAAVPAGTPMTFSPGSIDGSTFQPVGIVGLKRAAPVADLAAEAALADVVAKVNEILASERAANQRAG